ncbi:MAG: tetratricopeptide repeat protein, partial [Pseudomonadota bacterium]
MKILAIRGLQGFVLGAVLLAFSGNSNAAAKYTKESVKIRGTQTERTKIEEKAPEKRPEGPAIGAEQFRAMLQAKVAKLTEAAIKKLKQLIEVTDDDDPEKADFFFRLAEHYRDKKTLYSFQARELDEAIYLAKGEQKKRLEDRQKQYEKLAKDWMIYSIKMYISIAQQPKWEKYKRMDEVLFNVADMLNQADRRDKARMFFGKLIRNYPQSKYIPDAYLSFAEYYFNDGKVPDALRLYEQVGKYTDSPIYGYAIYKQGWCHLNLQNHKRALELFVDVIRNADKWAGPQKGKIILVKEARKDAVRAYSQAGSTDARKAWNFFKNIGGSSASVMLESLADFYYDQGKFLPSIGVIKQLMSLFPESKKLCKWQYFVLRSTLPGKDKAFQVQEARRLAAVYDTVKKRGDLTKAAMAECRGDSAAVLRELATTWHQEAQKTQNRDTYSLAELLYKEYLGYFPEEKDSYEMGFYYAELLFVLERWEEAATAYTKVVTQRATGKYLKEAAFAAVISWKNALNVKEEVEEKEKLKEGEKCKERTIPPNKLKMMAAFDTYLKYVP